MNEQKEVEGESNMFKTKKGAKIAYLIFATLTVGAFCTIVFAGINVVTVMFWSTSLSFLISVGASIGYLERIEAIENRVI